MKLRFYIQDFEISEASCEAERNEQAAAQANAKLERYIEKYGKVVYGHASIGSNVIIEGFHGIEHSDADHRAVLINIESLQAKCAHEPYWRAPSFQATCMKCGKLLKHSGWEVAE